MTISAGEARKDLFSLIKRVNDDHTPVRISSKNGDADLMSAEDYDSWQETVCLLRSPANARSLMEAVARDRAGEAVVAKTMAELEELAGEGGGASTSHRPDGGTSCSGSARTAPWPAGSHG